MIYCKNFCQCHNEPPVQKCYDNEKINKTLKNKEEQPYNNNNKT
jgi:hypothetical protein